MQNSGSLKQEQCLLEARNYSDKVARQKTNFNEGEQIFAVTATVSKSSQNKGDQSGNSVDEKSSKKVRIQDFDRTDCHQMECKIESVETETSQLKVLKPAEDIHKADKGTLPSERKTEGEKSDDSTSVAQIEGCVGDIEDGEIVEPTLKEDKRNSNDVAELNEKKERNTAERDPVKKQHSCLYN